MHAINSLSLKSIHRLDCVFTDKMALISWGSWWQHIIHGAAEGGRGMEAAQNCRGVPCVQIMEPPHRSHISIKYNGGQKLTTSVSRQTCMMARQYYLDY